MSDTKSEAGEAPFVSLSPSVAAPLVPADTVYIQVGTDPYELLDQGIEAAVKLSGREQCSEHGRARHAVQCSAQLGTAIC
jgi:hypothetical protein